MTIIDCCNLASAMLDIPIDSVVRFECPDMNGYTLEIGSTGICTFKRNVPDSPESWSILRVEHLTSRNWSFKEIKALPPVEDPYFL